MSHFVDYFNFIGQKANCRWPVVDLIVATILD